jgi:hypothetical protein
MKNRLRKFLSKPLLLAILALYPVSGLMAQQGAFALIPRKGASALGVNLNVVVPVFVAPLGKIPEGQEGGISADLGVFPGGLGSLIYQFFVTDTLSIGGELKYNLMFDKNYKFNLINPDDNRGFILHIVPVVFKVSQYFDILRQFSMFVEGNAGAAVVAYGEQVEGINVRTADIVPALGIGFGGMWNVNYRWSMGLGINWWSYFEFASGSAVPYVFNTIDIGFRLSFMIQS